MFPSIAQTTPSFAQQNPESTSYSYSPAQPNDYYNNQAFSITKEELEKIQYVAFHSGYNAGSTEAMKIAAHTVLDQEFVYNIKITHLINNKTELVKTVEEQAQTIITKDSEIADQKLAHTKKDEQIKTLARKIKQLQKQIADLQTQQSVSEQNGKRQLAHRTNASAASTSCSNQGLRILQRGEEVPLSLLTVSAKLSPAEKNSASNMNSPTRIPTPIPKSIAKMTSRITMN